MIPSTTARRLSMLVVAAVVGVLVPLATTGAADARPAAPTSRQARHAAPHQLSPKAAWLRQVSRRLADAPAYLDARARQGGRLDVVLGIDDVALATRYDWPHGVGPTLRVVQHARQLGMAVFFVTGRLNGDARRLAGPLHKAGFRFDGICGRDRGRRIAPAKTICRSAIEERGYTITANISSHTLAFRGGHFERSFLLPQIGRG
jgi:hypothetical protein